MAGLIADRAWPWGESNRAMSDMVHEQGECGPMGAPGWPRPDGPGQLIKIWRSCLRLTESVRFASVP